MLASILFLFAIVLSILSLAIGPADLGLSEVLKALAGQGREVDRIIIYEIRLPRTILAFVIGATLAVSGAALQGLVRNPLASPSLLGSSNFAALGAVVSIYFLSGTQYPLIVSLSAICFSVLSVFLLLYISGRDTRVMTLILAGLALSSLASALIALALNLSPNPFAVTEITFWLLGSLSDRTFSQVSLALPFMFVCWSLLLYDRKALLGFTLGEDVAHTLGISTRAAKWRISIAVAFGIGAAVAVSGVIGFIGLVIPHLVRPLVKYDPAKLLIPSAFAGACLLLASDCLVRLVPTSSELKLGVVTSLIGVPFFLFLVLRERQGKPAFI